MAPHLFRNTCLHEQTAVPVEPLLVPEPNDLHQVVDARIRFLAKRLDELTVVDRPPKDQAKVFFGAWVRLADETGEEARYRLVGSDEFDRAPEFISIDSPVARKLLGKSVGDEVDLPGAGGETTWEVVAIGYEPG